MLICDEVRRMSRFVDFKTIWKVPSRSLRTPGLDGGKTTCKMLIVEGQFVTPFPVCVTSKNLTGGIPDTV
jgi:hypothetical protein